MTSQASILIANHHTRALPDLDRALSERGLQVLHSSTSLETLAALREHQPDMLVFQPLTPAIDGFEVRRILHPESVESSQSNEDPASAPSSCLLILEDPASLMQILEHQEPAVEDFLCRPVSPEELLVRIDIGLRRHRELEQLRQVARSLAQETVTDFKTGLYNDRYFFQRLSEELRRSRRHGLALSMIMFDFDNFKQINDNFDHVFGDFVLLSFARKLRSIIRQTDIPARLGGDEFALLLPNTDVEEAALLATRLRTLVGEAEFTHQGHSTHLGLSMGIDGACGSDAPEPKEFLRRADQALLEAKRRGKNRICLYAELDRNAAAAP